MDRHLNVQTDRAACPFARVPEGGLWNLVEYLSFQRVHVVYHFEKGDLHVTFPTLGPAAAQRILDDWAHAECETGAKA